MRVDDGILFMAALEELPQGWRDFHGQCARVGGQAGSAFKDPRRASPSRPAFPPATTDAHEKLQNYMRTRLRQQLFLFRVLFLSMAQGEQAPRRQLLVEAPQKPLA